MQRVGMLLPWRTRAGFLTGRSRRGIGALECVCSKRIAFKHLGHAWIKVHMINNNLLRDCVMPGQHALRIEGAVS